jgi:hypothetical protein
MKVSTAAALLIRLVMLPCTVGAKPFVLSGSISSEIVDHMLASDQNTACISTFLTGGDISQNRNCSEPTISSIHCSRGRA